MSIEVIGHTTTRLILERELPVAALLVGPRSIGKWTLVRRLALQHRTHPVDRMFVDGLTVDTVRSITAFAQRAPFGPFKLIAIRLDGSSRAALNALLKTLEEPPPKVRFLMTSSTPLLPTVMSRCEVFRLGLLNVKELTDVLTRQGLAPGRAAQAARQGRGQVQVALTADAGNDEAKARVLEVVKAISTGDRDMFDRAFKTWDPACCDLLSTVIAEGLTGRWLVFAEDDACGLHRHRHRLLDMAAAISRLPAARPKLGVRAALEPFIVRS